MPTKKQVYEFFIKPPIWFDCIVWAAALAAIGGSVVFLCSDNRAEIYALAVYAVALILVVASVYVLLTFGDVPERVAKNPHVKKFVADFGYRSYVLAVCSAIFNSIYAVFGTMIAVYGRSVWLGALVWYHMICAVSRALIAFTVKKHFGREDYLKHRLRAYTESGGMLMALALAVIPVVILVVAGRNSYVYFGGAIVYCIALALHTVIKAIVQFYNRKRAAEFDSPSLSAVRNIGVADALVSIFALQATMLTVFQDAQVAAVLNPITGGAVALAIFVMGLYMTVSGIKRERRGDYGKPPVNSEEGMESEAEGLI